MQRFFAVLFAFAISTWALACGHTPETGESIAEVCHALNNGKLKSVSGYIGISRSTTTCTTTCNLLVRTQKAAGGREMNAVFALGTENNELEELPADFTEKDLRIKDKNGKSIHAGDVVRITGKLIADTRNGRIECSIAATTVEGLGGWP